MSVSAWCPMWLVSEDMVDMQWLETTCHWDTFYFCFSPRSTAEHCVSSGVSDSVPVKRWCLLNFLRIILVTENKQLTPSSPRLTMICLNIAVYEQYFGNCLHDLSSLLLSGSDHVHWSSLWSLWPLDTWDLCQDTRQGYLQTLTGFFFTPQSHRITYNE